MDCRAAYEQLVNSIPFQQWKKKHPCTYLSHCYAGLSTTFSVGSWEIGFYHPEHDTITVFAIGDQIVRKPEEGIFKPGKNAIEELLIAAVAFPQEAALAKFLVTYQQKYKKLGLVKGFVVLQMIDEVPQWNISFVTHELTVLNLKIDASTGEVLHDEVVTVIERK